MELAPKRISALRRREKRWKRHAESCFGVAPLTRMFAGSKKLLIMGSFSRVKAPDLDTDRSRTGNL
jgi:hypothetical protein